MQPLVWASFWGLLLVATLQSWKMAFIKRPSSVPLSSFWMLVSCMSYCASWVPSFLTFVFLCHLLYLEFMVCLSSMAYMFCILILPFEFEPVWKGGNFETDNLQMFLLCIVYITFTFRHRNGNFSCAQRWRLEIRILALAFRFVYMLQMCLISVSLPCFHI